MLSVKIDDIRNNRHVSKKKPVDQDYLRKLAQVISNAGFMDLSDEYSGTKQKDLLETVDISITIGAKTHHSKVMNRVEPEPFQTVRERIEECGKNELGLVQLSTRQRNSPRWPANRIYWGADYSRNDRPRTAILPQR